ncbi:uncharacterized protein UBRO_01246 [Ustilago bromivora]|uniref:Uncharacterized protein n=1 Tax=Ustilago bromivora TaxID=307758 RepID=A0A1K0FYH3_9BASI|nr:uncharacterized protein UBRO_01246 [Ustilago bromivora]SYW83227.1 uncharacterized protein UBRO2_05118 [Ustilago bromivora]
MPMIAPLPRHPLQEPRGSRVERQQRDDKILETLQSRRAAAPYTTRMFVSRPPSSIARPCQKSGSIHSTFFGIGRDAGINTDHESEHVAKTSSLTTSTETAQPASLNSDRYLPPLQQLHGLPRQQLHHAQDHQDQIAVPTEAQPSTDHAFSSTTSFHTWDSDGINWDDVVSWGSLDV